MTTSAQSALIAHNWSYFVSSIMHDAASVSVAGAVVLDVLAPVRGAVPMLVAYPVKLDVDERVYAPIVSDAVANAVPVARAPVADDVCVE